MKSTTGTTVKKTTSVGWSWITFMQAPKTGQLSYPEGGFKKSKLFYAIEHWIKFRGVL